MSKIIYVAVKVEKGQVVDTVAFDKEEECEAFCMQTGNFDMHLTAITDLKHALLNSIV